MRIRYGNFRHGIAEADLSIRSQEVANAFGTAVATEVIWSWRGRLKNPTGNSKTLDGILRNFYDSYAVNGFDLVLEHTDGTPTYHALLNRNCLGGTRVTVKPQFPTGRQGEGVNYRSYEIEVRGTVPLGAASLMAFQETISIRGGRARYGCKEVNVGVGVRHRLRTHSTCIATQSGSATGYFRKPNVPPPIWPFALADELPDETLQSPLTVGEGADAAYLNHTTTWSYSYQWIDRLLGTPHYLLG